MATSALRSLAFGVVFVTGIATQLRKAAVKAPHVDPLVDVTEIVQKRSFTESGYKCCCSKYKGWKDGLRFWAEHAGYCQISKTESCGGYLGLFGGVKVTPQTSTAHNYEDTDGKCEIPSASFPFEDFYATHGSPSNYCSADIVFRTVSDEVLVASASVASLGEEVAYSCPDGWEVPAGEGKVTCVFESAHAGRFTGASCQRIQEVSTPTPRPTEDQNKDEGHHDDGIGDEGETHQTGDEDETKHQAEGEDDNRQGHQDSVEDNDQRQTKDEFEDEGESEDEGKDENYNRNEDEDDKQHSSEDETDDQKWHQDDDEGDESRHDNPSQLQPTSTPTDAETINTVIDGITEEAKAICKRGQQSEFCCVRQCKKIAEENAKDLMALVNVPCVQDCSQAWRESHTL